jgi:hypothetical protein
MAAAATVVTMTASTMPNSRCRIAARSTVRPMPDHGRRSARRRNRNTKLSVLIVMPKPPAAYEITAGSQAVAAWKIVPMISTQPKNPSQANRIRHTSRGRRSESRNTPDDAVSDAMSIPKR